MLDIIINSECERLPKYHVPLDGQDSALLNYLSCLGYEINQLPFADLLARNQHLEGHWVALSPIHWHASHNDAVVVAAGQTLELSEDESRYWFEHFSKVFAIDGCRSYFYDTHTWLLSSSDMPSLNAKPVAQLLNQSLMPELAHLGSSMYWQKLFTEGQMFFAAHAEQPLINGLWAWGGGQLELQHKRVIVDELFLPFATLSTTHVIPYNSSVSLHDGDILLIDSINVLSNEHKKRLSSTTARWFWRNSAYIHKKTNCVSRFWRSLFYAN